MRVGNDDDHEGACTANGNGVADCIASDSIADLFRRGLLHWIFTENLLILQWI